MKPWISIQNERPKEGVIVDTCINDGKGLRNQCDLKLVGGLWFFPDMSMYVYYTPTHWRAK